MAKSRRIKSKTNKKRSHKMRTGTRSRTRRSHSHQKLWNQKGCSRSHRHSRMCKRGGGGCGCSSYKKGGKALEIMPFKGGSCASCQLMKGGSCQACNLMKGGGGVPAPLVGAPWTPEISGWPGVQGLSGQTNYLAMNQYPVDLQTNGMMSSATQNDLTNASLVGRSNHTASMVGGGRRSRRMRRTRGGGLIPQDLVNFGRTFSYGLGSAYNSLAGLPQSPNPLPYKDQLPGTMTANQLRQ